MRTLSRLAVTALASAGVSTLLAIAVNVATSESVPAPLGMFKPYAYWVMLGLWLLTALVIVLQDLPRQRAARLKDRLEGPDRLDQAVRAVRVSLDHYVKERIGNSRLFPEFRLPQIWQSAQAGSRVRLATGPSGTLAPTDYVRALEKVPSHRLVVCGVAGAGKTDWLYTYARGALANQGSVPLLLDLSQWRRDLEFQQWAGLQLSRLFPELDVPTGKDLDGRDTTLIEMLLRSNRFVLLLDGFDEVAPAHRPELLTALNTGLWLDQAIIMTSRPEAYPDHGLRDSAAITILPLAVDQVGMWLANVFPSAADTDRWQPVQRALRSPDSPLASALSTPLMATLMGKVFEDRASRPADLADTARFPIPESITSQLLDGLVPAAYRRSGQRPKWTAGQAGSWLEFLGTHTRRGGIAWWRLFQMVPRWRFAAYSGLLIGLFTATVAGYVTWGFLTTLPANQYTSGDFFQQPLLILQSWFENVVHTLSGRDDPSPPVSAVAVGSAVGAVATGWLTGALLGPREGVWWRRVSWPSSPVGQPRKAALLGIGYSVVLSAVAGGVLGAIGSAIASVLLVSAGSSAALFWLAVGVGAKVGAVTGAAVGLYSGVDGEPPLPWYRLSPDAPAALRITLPRSRRVILVAAGGAVLGTVVALGLGRNPGPAAGFGAAIAVVTIVWFVMDGITEHAGPGPADQWQAIDAEHPATLLRHDLLASVTRLVAAAAVGTPLLLSQVSPLRPDIARILFGLWLLFSVIRELGTRAWSWYLVAVFALAVRRRMPWPVLRFLEDARNRHILRLEGGSYHFRHHELADRFSRALPATASRPTETPRTNPAKGAWRSSRLDDDYRQGFKLATEMVGKGEAAGARDELGTILARARQTGDDDAALIIRGALAQLRSKEGDRAAAVAELTALLSAQLARFGPDHREPVNTRLRLARLLTGKRALAQVDAILAARPESLPPDDALLVRTHLRAAELHEGGDRLVALHHATMAEAGLPPDDPRAVDARDRQLRSRLDMIVAFAPAQERLNELAELLDEARDKVGDDHVTTIGVRVELAKACGKAHRWAEAEEHWLAVTEWTATNRNDFTDKYREQLRKAQRRRPY